MRASIGTGLLLLHLAGVPAMAGAGLPPCSTHPQPPPGRWLLLESDPQHLLAVGRGEQVLPLPQQAVGEEGASPVTDWLAGWLPLEAEEGLREVAARRWNGWRSSVCRRTRAGVPVGDDRAVVTIGPSGRACALALRWGLCGAPASLAFPDSAAAVQAAEAFLAAGGVRLRRDLGPLWVPAETAEVPPLRPCRRVEIACERPAGCWRLTVGPDGGILSCRDRLRHGSVPGIVRLLADDPGWCAGPRRFPGAGLLVEGSDGDAVSDAAGTFDLPVAGEQVILTARLRGPSVTIDLWNSDRDAVLVDTLAAGQIALLEWTDQNSRADERDAWRAVDRARTWLAELLPDWPPLDQPLAVRVGREDSYCPGDAWYEYGTLNFCEAGAGFANSATVGDVVVHELGHAVTDRLYGPLDPPDDVDEGNSDFLANLIGGESRIGVGFWEGDCARAIRDSDNDLRYPEDWTGDPHRGGGILAGFLWDAWRNLAADLGEEAAADLIARLWIGSRLLGLPMSLPEQVALTFVADDDDEDLTDGTPHREALRAAAVAHGFAAPPLTWGLEIEHEPLGAGLTAAAGREVRAVIRATAAPLDPASPRLRWRLDGEWTAAPMVPAGGDTFAAMLPPESCGLEVAYYLSAADVLGRTATLPPEAPDESFAYQSLGDTVVFRDDAESDRGWTAGLPDDDATSGFWERADPQLVLGSGIISQPEDDTTPAPGSLCFVTGAALGSGTGSHDVDGGTTSLLGPRLDLSGLAEAWVAFDAWIFSGVNTTEPEPLRLLYSPDDGATWTELRALVGLGGWQRVTVPLAGQPLTALARLKFVVQDPYPPTLVEALVDEIAVHGCTAPPPPPAPPPPQCALVSPAPGSGLLVGTTTKISWKASGPAPLESYDLLLSRDGGLTWPDTLRRAEPYASSCAWTVTGPQTRAAVLRLRVRGADGVEATALGGACRILQAIATKAGRDRPRLAGAAPNPCNPSTRIRFRLDRPGEVRLTILDAAGRRVAVLWDGPLAAGEHALRWQGADAAGRPVAAGVYLACLEVEGRRQVGKIALVR